MAQQVAGDVIDEDQKEGYATEKTSRTPRAVVTGLVNASPRLAATKNLISFSASSAGGRR